MQNKNKSFTNYVSISSTFLSSKFRESVNQVLPKFNNAKVSGFTVVASYIASYLTIDNYLCSQPHGLPCSANLFSKK